MSVLISCCSEKWKHKKCTLEEVFKGAVIFLEAAIMEPATQVAGAQVIFDMDGLSLQQTWQFSPQFAKRIVDWLQVRCGAIARKRSVKGRVKEGPTARAARLKLI